MARVRLDVDRILHLALDAGFRIVLGVADAHPRCEARVAGGSGAGAPGQIRVLAGTDLGETDESDKRSIEDAPCGWLHDGKACIDDSECDFKSGPQSIFDDGYGEVDLRLGCGELNHMVCSPCRSETNKNTQAKDEGKGNLLARAHMQSPEHRHWENQDADIENEVEDGTEKELVCEVAAVLGRVRSKAPIVLERAASGRPSYYTSKQVSHGCRLEEVDDVEEPFYGGEDLPKKFENGKADKCVGAGLQEPAPKECLADE